MTGGSEKPVATAYVIFSEECQNIIEFKQDFAGDMFFSWADFVLFKQ